MESCSTCNPSLSSESKKRRRSPKWSDAEIKALIQWRIHFEPQFRKCQTEKTALWQKVARCLQREVICMCERTAQMCEVKWINVTQNYQKMKIEEQPIEGYYKDLDLFMANKKRWAAAHAKQRYVTVTYGNVKKRIRIEARTESIMECIMCMFGLIRFPQLKGLPMWVVDDSGHFHTIDCNLPPYKTYALHIGHLPPDSCL
ncbi:hypothetical protein SUGI_0863240 [Cryptomeria japonica]|nr:hypothetical protein SUGI_0863240 [Cryptomeria japonica]